MTALTILFISANIIPNPLHGNKTKKKNYLSMIKSTINSKISSKEHNIKERDKLKEPPRRLDVQWPKINISQK